MTERSPARDPDVPAWILWPVRAVAVVTIVPLRLLWELLGVIASLIGRYVFRPLAWLWHYLVVVPLAWLWHYLVVVPLAWLWHYLVVVPVVWVAKWLWARREAIGRFLKRWVLRPLYYLLVLPVSWLVKYLLVVPLAWVVRTLRPVWRALGHAIVAVWNGTGSVLSVLGRGIAVVAVVLYRFVLRPFGQAAAWLWRNTIVLLARGIAAVWRATVVPVWRATAVPLGRWLRDAVLRPTAATLRSVRTALGFRRAR